MKITRQSNLILYLIAVIMLMMQSFALWHDVEHPFHKNNTNHALHSSSTLEEQPHTLWHDVSSSVDESNAQCERLNAFANNPSIDDLAQIKVLIRFSITEIFSDPFTEFYSTKQRDIQAIRAPPTFIS